MHVMLALHHFAASRSLPHENGQFAKRLDFAVRALVAISNHLFQVPACRSVDRCLHSSGLVLQCNVALGTAICQSRARRNLTVELVSACLPQRPPPDCMCACPACQQPHVDGASSRDRPEVVRPNLAARRFAVPACARHLRVGVGVHELAAHRPLAEPVAASRPARPRTQSICELTSALGTVLLSAMHCIATAERRGGGAGVPLCDRCQLP